jgi:hypothetical protein
MLRKFAQAVGCSVKSLFLGAQMWRFLRSVVSAVCLLACVTIFTSLVRSYYSRDWLWNQTPQYIGLSACRGNITLEVHPKRVPAWLIAAFDESKWHLSHLPAHEYRPLTEPQLLGFGYDWDRRIGHTVIIPHWFLAITAAGLALAAKPKPRLRYSLRGLLVVITVAAMFAGAIAAFWRLPI